MTTPDKRSEAPEWYLDQLKGCPEPADTESTVTPQDNDVRRTSWGDGDDMQDSLVAATYLCDPSCCLLYRISL